MIPSFGGFMQDFSDKSTGYGKLERIAKFLGGTIAIGVLGILGIKAKRQIDSRKKLKEFLEGWQEAPYYNPRIVLLYSQNNDAGIGLKEAVLSKGYGMICVTRKSDAIEAINEVGSIRAVLSQYDGTENLRQNEVRKGEFYLPMIKAQKRASNPGKLLGNLEKIIDEEDEKAHKLLREIAGYYETESGRSGFHKAPEKIESAMQQIIRLGYITRKQSFEAHRTGIISMLQSGTPINRTTHYGDWEGLCLKIESSSDIDEIMADSAHFDVSGNWVNVSKPFFYGNLDDESVIVARSYFIGPILAQVFPMLKSAPAENRQFANEAIRRTLNAVFEVSAEYNQYKRKALPMNDDARMDAVLDYYKSSLGAGYDRLSQFFSKDMFRKEEVLELLEDRALKNREWYVRIMDIFLPNVKLLLGIEEPALEELIGFYSKNGSSASKNDVIGEKEIKEKLGFYDQGYRDWHIVDNFVRSGFSAYGLNAEEGLWIDLAKIFFRKEYSAIEKDYLARNGLSGRITRILAKLERVEMPSSVISSRSLIANFFIISAYKLFKLVDNSISGGLRNEKSFAAGELMPEDYNSYRQNYLGNALTYAENLSLVALTGAEYFDTYKRAPSSFWEALTGVEQVFGRVVKERSHYERKEYSNALSKNLALYAAIGRELASSADKFKAHLYRERDSSGFIVEFKSSK